MACLDGLMRSGDLIQAEALHRNWVEQSRLQRGGDVPDSVLVGSLAHDVHQHKAHSDVFAQELTKGKKPIEMGEIEIWLPNAVVIDQKEDLKEPMWFVLENPTGIDHEFSVGGLFTYATKEQVPLIAMDPITGQVLTENMVVPIRVMVKAGETKKIRVAPVGIAGDRNHGASYRFFCPKHKDIRVSGFIFVD